MTAFRYAPLILFAFSTACSPEGNGTPEVPWSLEELEAPAAVGSLWPDITPDGDGFLLTWLEPGAGDSWTLLFSRFDTDGWLDPYRLADSNETPFFVNWADFPHVASLPDGTWAAHWLWLGEHGGLDYDVALRTSRDRGETWSEVMVPHTDRSPIDHGFVSMFPAPDGGLGMLWLDGRDKQMSDDGQGDPAGPPMVLMYRSLLPDGTFSDEVMVDDKVCDCCQTDVAIASSGPVAVYRDRAEGEIRDTYVARMVDGEWQPGESIHHDGWVMPACPVNGPAVDARGDDVAVAWFTAASGDPEVYFAFSDDSGSTFGPPTRFDDGNPLGRLDVRLLEDGSALLTWLEWASQEEARILARIVSPSGTMGELKEIATTASGRGSGFPRTAQDAEGRIVFAWIETGEPGGVRLARTVGPVGATER